MIGRKPLISVVVPVYKAERWLRDCVDSILMQTLSDIEVLLVDDGSPDGCGAICDEYAKKDARVRVFHKENGGISMARKTGVDNATADWMVFVDDDDTLPRTALEDLYGEREGSDIIIGRSDDKTYDRDCLTPEENRRFAISGKYIRCTPWARLIARHLFNDNTFPPREMAHGEDMLMNIGLAFANQKPVRLVSKKVYNYNFHQGSTNHLFQNSVDYETLFATYRDSLIPKEQREQYEREIVMNSLDSFEDMYRTHRQNVWHGTTFYKDTLLRAKRCGYHIPLSQRIKLRITNTTLLRLYMMSESFLNYRLGLLKNKFLRKN